MGCEKQRTAKATGLTVTGDLQETEDRASESSHQLGEGVEVLILYPLS